MSEAKEEIPEIPIEVQATAPEQTPKPKRTRKRKVVNVVSEPEQKEDVDKIKKELEELQAEKERKKQILSDSRKKTAATKKKNSMVLKAKAEVLDQLTEQVKKERPKKAETREPEQKTYRSVREFLLS